MVIHLHCVVFWDLFVICCSYYLLLVVLLSVGSPIPQAPGPRLLHREQELTA